MNMDSFAFVRTHTERRRTKHQRRFLFTTGSPPCLLALDFNPRATDLNFLEASPFIPKLDLGGSKGSCELGLNADMEDSTGTGTLKDWGSTICSIIFTCLQARHKASRHGYTCTIENDTPQDLGHDILHCTCDCTIVSWATHQLGVHTYSHSFIHLHK